MLSYWLLLLNRLFRRAAILAAKLSTLLIPLLLHGWLPVLTMRHLRLRVLVHLTTSWGRFGPVYNICTRRNMLSCRIFIKVSHAMWALHIRTINC
jgi:hypothetical protein